MVGQPSPGSCYLRFSIRLPSILTDQLGGTASTNMTARSSAVQRPLSEFLPYLPYRPSLDQGMDWLEARRASTERPLAEAQPNAASTSEPTTKKNKREQVHPKALCPSKPSPASNTTSRSTLIWDSFTVNPPLANTSPLPDPPPTRVLTLPPSLMANSYKPQRTAKRHFNSIAPLGSEENPAELPGTTPPQYFSDFQWAILGVEYLGEFLGDPSFM